MWVVLEFLVGVVWLVRSVIKLVVLILGVAGVLCRFGGWCACGLDLVE